MNNMVVKVPSNSLTAYDSMTRSFMKHTDAIEGCISKKQQNSICTRTILEKREILNACLLPERDYPVVRSLQFPRPSTHPDHSPVGEMVAFTEKKTNCSNIKSDEFCVHLYSLNLERKKLGRLEYSN